MKISVLVVGRSRGPLASAVRAFEERAARYWKLDVVEVRAGGGRGRALDPAFVRDSEGERLGRRIPAGSEIWALTRGGSGLSSGDFARLLGSRATEGRGGVTFLVGGAFGLAPALLSRADRLLALSEMTLPHEFARLLLAEQLYRAGTILRGEPYHKGSA